MMYLLNYRLWKLELVFIYCFLVVTGCVDDSLPHNEAVIEIKKLGGSVELRDEIIASVSFEGDSATDKAIHLCARIPNLKSLVLLKAKISPAGYQDLWKLRELEGLALQSSGNVTDSAVIGINTLERLKSLSLYETQVTDLCLSEVGKLTNLGVLGLGKTQVTDAGMRHLKNLKGLDTLTLQSTQVSGSGLKHLVTAKSLRNLFLSGSQVDDVGLVSIAELQGIRSLHLKQTKVTDNGILNLAIMPNLESIYLQSTQVTPAGVEAFQRLRKEKLQNTIKDSTQFQPVYIDLGVRKNTE